MKRIHSGIIFRVIEAINIDLRMNFRKKKLSRNKRKKSIKFLSFFHFFSRTILKLFKIESEIGRLVKFLSQLFDYSIMFIALRWGISSSGQRKISLLHGGKIWEGNYKQFPCWRVVRHRDARKKWEG